MTKIPVEFPVNPTNCPPFAASMSDRLRLMLAVMPDLKEKITGILRGVVADLTSRDDVVRSLCSESVPGIARAMRQVDIKDDNMKVIFKTFTFWDDDRKIWFILVEMADETFFEDSQETVGRG